VIGADLSPGMLAAARDHAGDAALVNAEVTALPLATGSVDLLLAMHMLYHVPDPLDAVREFRRVTRPGGTVVVGLNGADHLRELLAAITAAGGKGQVERLRLDAGETLLGSVFGAVTRIDFASSMFPPPDVIAASVRSRSESQQLPDAEPLVARVLSLLFPNGPSRLPITTHCGILIGTTPS
jgi:SAM-dependent methyltransferase